MEIKWEEPTPDGRGNKPFRDWAGISALLRDRPGEWAVVAEDVSVSTASHIKRGRFRGFVAGEFEAVSRNVINGRAEKIYARYVGPVTS